MKTFLVAAIVGVFATSSWAALNLNSSKSNVNRILHSASYLSASTNIGACRGTPVAPEVLPCPPPATGVETALR